MIRRHSSLRTCLARIYGAYGCHSVGGGDENSPPHIYVVILAMRWRKFRHTSMYKYNVYMFSIRAFIVGIGLAGVCPQFVWTQTYYPIDRNWCEYVLRACVRACIMCVMCMCKYTYSFLINCSCETIFIRRSSILSWATGITNVDVTAFYWFSIKSVFNFWISVIWSKT